MLETIWFALWGILWAVYFVLDGFDFGIGTLAPFIAKNENEKRAVYNSMATLLERQRGLADNRRRSYFRRIPENLRSNVQQPLFGPAPDPVSAS